MRPLALVLALTLMTSGLASAADANQTGKQAAEFAKRVTLAVQAAKAKTGQFPATVSVVVNGKAIDIKVQVTPLAEGYSIKAQPSVDAKAGCPLESCNIDVNADKTGATIVSLVGTAADGSDIVAFATTGTELAVTVTQGDQTTTMTTTTAAADVPAQSGEAVAVKPTEPVVAPAIKPAATQPAAVATSTTTPAADDASTVESAGKVVSAATKATVTHLGKQVPAVAGTSLAVGDVISVIKADSKSPLTLDLFDGASVKLTSGAQLTIVSNESDPVIALGPNEPGKSGTDYDATIDSGVLTQIGRHLVVNTPTGVVRTTGTLYTIHSDAHGNAVVTVTVGSITIKSPAFPGVPMTVTAGQKLMTNGNTMTLRGADGNAISTTTVTTVNGVTTSTTVDNVTGAKTTVAVTGNDVVTTHFDASGGKVGETVATTLNNAATPVITQIDQGEKSVIDSRNTSRNDVFSFTPPAGGGSGFILSIDATPTNTPVSRDHR